MEAFAIIAIVGFGLLLAELLLPTGGLLAVIGVAGLVAAGLVALDSNNSDGDVIGAALITLGIVSAITVYFVTRKVVSAQRDERVRGGTEEMVGALAEARSAIAPDGKVFMRGTLWGARLASGGAPVALGDKVRVEAVDGLTLVVRPEPKAAETPKEGAS
ncbi:MAG TPA: NfeD family protein [Solirubrobacterales bacterium]|nr:NfeD family protein [Solirubrobacterales bacterium]